MAISKKYYTGKIPFANGSPLRYDPGSLQLVYDRASARKIPVTWKDNFIFTDEMYIDRPDIGNKVSGFYLKNKAGNEYYCSIRTIREIIQNNIITNGWLPPLQWTFKKIGSSFLMVLA